MKAADRPGRSGEHGDKSSDCARHNCVLSALIAGSANPYPGTPAADLPGTSSPLAVEAAGHEG